MIAAEDEVQVDTRLKITPEQTDAIHSALSTHGVELAALLKKAELVDLADLASEDAPTVAPCSHERLNEEGICRQCGADKRGIG